MSREICIENLPAPVEVYKLSKIFKDIGRIISCKIDVDQKFASLGKGYIVFDDPASAQSAVETMDKQNIWGVQIKVSLIPNSTDDTDKIMETYTKIYIKNIPLFWEDSELLMEFSEFGEIVTAQVSMSDGKSNGYGFVIFNKHSSAKKAVMHKHQDLVVKPFIPKSIRSKTAIPSVPVENDLNKITQNNNLHVKNIPEYMDDSALKELFEEFGTTTSVKVARDRNTGKSLKYGFVCFESAKDAEEALSVMNGRQFHSKSLVVSFFKKKEDRQQIHEKMNLNGANGEEKEKKSRSKVLFSFSST